MNQNPEELKRRSQAETTALWILDGIDKLRQGLAIDPIQQQFITALANEREKLMPGT